MYAQLRKEGLKPNSSKIEAKKSESWRRDAQEMLFSIHSIQIFFFRERECQHPVLFVGPSLFPHIMYFM